MKICSWNINGLRSLGQPLRNVLEQLDCDIICFQETKVTRQALGEEYARIDGYHAFYSWSRLRSGYSGVAIICKSSLAPIHAEEGLCGKLHTNLIDGLGNEYPTMDENELLAIDREGRAIMTEHELEDGTTLVIINVYCPRVDSDKPERLTYKLNFFSAIEHRAKFFLQRGCRVIVVGDFNVSHRTIDTCRSIEDLNYFNTSPSRLWFSKFLNDVGFTDTYRFLHPDEREAYTCWETLSNARVNNYGVRIDYILCDETKSRENLINCQHRTDVQSSDHCPVIAEFNFSCKDRTLSKPPSICAKFWPEFQGVQMKLSQFIVKTKRSHDESENNKKRSVNESPIENRQKEESKETVINKSIVKPIVKKRKSDQTSLFQHFTRHTETKVTSSEDVKTIDITEEATSVSNVETTEKPKTSSWSQIFRPPTPPPLCSGHKERCVIRQVKDASSTNWGKYFYVCSRANGAPDNPEARCDFFKWKEIKKKTT